MKKTVLKSDYGKWVKNLFEVVTVKTKVTETKKIICTIVHDLMYADLLHGQFILMKSNQ